MKKLVLAIDFDGTIVSENYPKIGNTKRNAKEVINRLYTEGHFIIINSCRSGNEELDMIKFLENNKIKYHEVNRNLQWRIDLYQRDCRKIGADIYLDDKHYGNKIVNWADFYEYVNRRATQKPIIFAIVGESGTGKTTIADYIENEHNIKMVQSYTTRPKRYENETGHTFITEEEYKKYNKKDFIAYTSFGGNHYFCLKDDLTDLNSYVIDEDGLRMLWNNPDTEVISIRVLRQHKECISIERQTRDKGRFTIPLDQFNYVIENNGSLDELYDKIDEILKKEVWF